VAFFRFSRDKRGYEHFYLVEPITNRKGKSRTRVLYWYRTPPNVRVGRAPFDEEVRRALEQQNPNVTFDWAKILETPIPSADVDKWRERRRAERAERAARRPPAAEDLIAGEPSSAEEPSSADEPPDSAADEADPDTAIASTGDASAPAGAPTAEGGDDRRRRRRRRGRGRAGANRPSEVRGERQDPAPPPDADVATTDEREPPDDPVEPSSGE
jgi:hypothetical protein